MNERGSTGPCPVSGAASGPHPLGALPDLARVDRILGKLASVWRRVPDWRLAWLIVSLVPPGPVASDAEIVFVAISRKPRDGRDLPSGCHVVPVDSYQGSSRWMIPLPSSCSQCRCRRPGGGLHDGPAPARAVP